MTHDEEMWQDYDYHQNTGELPEYFDDDDGGYGGDGDSGSGCGPDYIGVHLVWSDAKHMGHTMSYLTVTNA